MPTIKYPNVPLYDGVPALLRPVKAAVAAVPAIAVSLGTLQALLGSAMQQAPAWGIFDAEGNQLGVSSTASLTVLDAIANQVTGDTGTVLSTLAFDYTKESRVSDFPIEGGSFANYNKVELPGAPVITLALEGSEDDRTNFLNAVDAACKSTDLFSVVTPEVTYANHSLERYNYRRTASKGATLLMVEVTLREIRTVSATYTTAATSPIQSPQNPAATPQVSNGMTQPTPPDVSTLKSLTNKLAGLTGAN